MEPAGVGQLSTPIPLLTGSTFHADPHAAGHLAIETLGEPPKEIVDADGVLLVRRR